MLLCATVIWPNLVYGVTPSYQAKVIAVIDGDTLQVSKRQAKITVDLAAVDAPERGQFYYLNAKGLLSQWVIGKYVTIVEQGSIGLDRIIARVYVNGRDINRSLVAKGAAWVAPSNRQDAGLLASQANAQIEKLGIWQQSQPTPPWHWREDQSRQTTPP